MTCRSAFCPALMGHTGIIDFVEQAVFYTGILTDIPKLHGVPKSDLSLAAPDAAADMTETASKDLGSDTLSGNAVDPAHFKREIFNAHIMAGIRKVPAAVYGTLDRPV